VATCVERGAYGPADATATRDVTDFESESESDGIRYFFQNPKSVGYLKSDHVGFEIFDSVQLYNYFRK